MVLEVLKKFWVKVVNFEADGINKNDWADIFKFGTVCLNLLVNFLAFDWHCFDSGSHEVSWKSVTGLINVLKVAAAWNRKIGWVEISPKTFWNYFEIKAAANEVDMATKPSFGKSEGG